MKSLSIFFSILFFLAFASCKNKTDVAYPSNQETFLRVYTDLVKLHERYSAQDSACIDSSQAILQKHGFTVDDYHRSLAYFNEKPERWEVFYREVLKRLNSDTTVTSSHPIFSYKKKDVLINKFSEAAPR